MFRLESQTSKYRYRWPWLHDQFSRGDTHHNTLPSRKINRPEPNFTSCHFIELPLTKHCDNISLIKASKLEARNCVGVAFFITFVPSDPQILDNLTADRSSDKLRYKATKIGTTSGGRGQGILLHCCRSRSRKHQFGARVRVLSNDTDSAVNAVSDRDRENIVRRVTAIPAVRNHSNDSGGRRTCECYLAALDAGCFACFHP